ADENHHRIDGETADGSEPLRFRFVAPALAVALGQLAADLLQVEAGIETLRDRSYGFAQSFEIAQVRGAGENVDLCSGVVGVVLANHAVAGGLQQRREHVSEHRTTDMTQMQRPGRVGGDILDIDAAPGTDVRPAPALARAQKIGQPGSPEVGGEPEVDEPRSG